MGNSRSCWLAIVLSAGIASMPIRAIANGGDNCAGATAAVDGVNAVDTTLATPDGPNHSAAQCQYAGTLFKNVWFTYQATCTGLLTVTTCEELGGGANYDTRIAVYSGTCGALTLLGCNDDDPDHPCGIPGELWHSTVQVVVAAGQNLLISVGGYDIASFGTANLNITCVSNDNCADAIPAVNGLNAVDTTQATVDGPTIDAQDCGGAGYGGTLHKNVWYTYQATCTGFLTVTTCEDLGGSADYDTRIGVFSGTCGSLTLLGCNDDDADHPCGQGPTLWHSTVEIAVTIGQNVLISVGGYDDASVGTASLNITCVNNDISGACCDFSTGTCTDVATQADCDGPSESFTFAVEGGDCLNPGPNFECITLIGACCDLTTHTCADPVLLSDCSAANQKFALGQTCATVICPDCMPGGDGQIADFGLHDGFYFNTSDLSTNNAGFRVADNFSPDTNAPLTSVRWWGNYRNFDGYPPGPTNVNCIPSEGSAPDNFTITIWNDAGFPYEIVSGPHSVTPLKEDTGFDIPFTATDQRRVWQFTVTGLNIPMTPNLCYWIEIVNDTAGTACNFTWLTGPEGDLKMAQWADGAVPSLADLNARDMAFCLNIAMADDVCDTALQLPGACCLNLGTVCDDTGGITACVAAGGTFRGINTLCTGPQAVSCQGACCGVNAAGASVPGAVSVRIEDSCLNLGGVFQGIGSAASPNPCDGRCCLSDGSCNDNGINPLSKVECEAEAPGGLGGSFAGGASCAGALCSTYDICDPDGLPVLTCGGSVTYNNLAQATEELDGIEPIPDTPDLSCFAGGFGVPGTPDDGIGAFWLSFIGTGGDVQISTCGSDVADTVIAVYSNPAKACNEINASDEVACNEDDGDDDPDGVICPLATQSRLCVPATVVGQLYYVQATSFDAASVGNIRVNMVCPCQVQVVCACPGDMSADNLLNAKDVQAFVNCLVSPGVGCECADSDGDAASDDEFGASGDIASFVSKLLSGATCP